MSGFRKKQGKDNKDKIKPQFHLKCPDPKDLDKLRLQSGTALQREMSECDRRKLVRDACQSRTTLLSPRRVTSSSDAMDTDEASRRTRNIFTRIRTQSLSPMGKGPIKAFPMSAVKKEESESDDESTKMESDLNTTVIPQESDLVGPLPLRVPVRASPSKPPAKLTYGVSPTLDEEARTVDPFSKENVKEEDLPDYTHGDLFLSIPGTPSINDLEPEETLQLTARGNRAKIVVIKLWGSKYQTERFMVDDLTGEIYAIKEMGIDVIKEQAYLDRKLAWDAAAVDFPELFTPLAEKEPPDKIGGVDVSQEKDGMSGVSPSENLEQKALRYQEFRETLQRYQSIRRQRRKLEGELLFFELPGKEPGITTDQEAERERIMALVQHKKILDQEMPLLKRRMELAPENPESEADHLSEISLGHYECEKDWTEQTYRRALFLYERRNKKASLLSHLWDVKARRYPHQSSIFKKELSEARKNGLGNRRKGMLCLKLQKWK